MSWVQDFYQKQAKWSMAYSGNVQAANREKAALLQEFVGSKPQSILELGAGGGQNAVAVAELGHEVVAVEIVPDLVQHIQQLSAKHTELNIKVIEADFNQVTFENQFDAICYWDGFGIGTDGEQRHLLQRMKRWLKKDGYALIDIFTPWHAAKSAGYQQKIGNAHRRYDFNADQCRWLDYWWEEGQVDQQISQSLRCYSPADLRLLLAGSGLELMYIRPGGMMDYETNKFTPKASLQHAMWFLAVLKRVA